MDLSVARSSASQLRSAGIDVVEAGERRAVIDLHFKAGVSAYGFALGIAAALAFFAYAMVKSDGVERFVPLAFLVPAVWGAAVGFKNRLRISIEEGAATFRWVPIPWPRTRARTLGPVRYMVVRNKRGTVTVKDQHADTGIKRGGTMSYDYPQLVFCFDDSGETTGIDLDPLGARAAEWSLYPGFARGLSSLFPVPRRKPQD